MPRSPPRPPLWAAGSVPGTRCCSSRPECPDWCRLCSPCCGWGPRTSPSIPPRPTPAGTPSPRPWVPVPPWWDPPQRWPGPPRRCRPGSLRSIWTHGSIAGGPVSRPPGRCRRRGRDRLRAVHLGEHRHAEGRGGQPRQRDPPARVLSRAERGALPLPAAQLALLRRCRRRHVLHPRPRGQPGPRPGRGGGDPGLAAHAVREERITHLEPVPSWYATLLEVAAAGDLDSVRVVILGGEVLPPELVAASRRALPAARLFNDYGPTEVTVAATVHEISPGGQGPACPSAARTRTPSSPCSTRNSGPSPPARSANSGSAGRAAQGYLGLPDHPSFQPDPATADAVTGPVTSCAGTTTGSCGSAAAATGRSRSAASGSSRRRSKPSSAGSPVSRARPSRSTPTGPEARLVAYVSPVPGTELAPETVSRALAERLPAHLRPAVVVVLPALPLTAGGKVDRRALPAVSRRGTSPRRGRGRRATTTSSSSRRRSGTSSARRRPWDRLLRGRGTEPRRGPSRRPPARRAGCGGRPGRSWPPGPPPAALAAVLRERPPVAAEEQLRRRERPADQEWRAPGVPAPGIVLVPRARSGGTGRSNLVEVLTFPRGTDPVLLGRAVEALVERHAALRTASSCSRTGCTRSSSRRRGRTWSICPRRPMRRPWTGSRTLSGPIPSISRAPPGPGRARRGPDGQPSSWSSTTPWRTAGASTCWSRSSPPSSGRAGTSPACPTRRWSSSTSSSGRRSGPRERRDGRGGPPAAAMLSPGRRLGETMPLRPWPAPAAPDTRGRRGYHADDRSDAGAGDRARPDPRHHPTRSRTPRRCWPRFSAGGLPEVRHRAPVRAGEPARPRRGLLHQTPADPGGRHRRADVPEVCTG